MATGESSEVKGRKIRVRRPTSHIFLTVIFVTVVCCLWAGPLGAQQGTLDGQWRSYGGDLGSTRYAPLDQIDCNNFDQLEQVWSWQTIDTSLSKSGPRGEWWGDAKSIFKALSNEEPDRWRGRRPPRISSLKATPLMVDGVLYLSTPLYQAAAIDASTGRTLWVYNPKSYESGTPAMSLTWNSRGVAYWTDGKKDERIYWGTGDGYLHAVNAKTGQPCLDFGDNGRVDLTVGIPRATRGEKDELGALLYSVSSPPIVCRDVLVTGSCISDRRDVQGTPPGDVRGWDVRTGKRKWTFHTIPKAGEYGNETWENESWKYTGNSNVWTMMSADESLGYVYLPTGTPTNDFYGGHRLGDNLFAECLVCVDVETGKRVWHFQAVHHGIWDYDFPCAPILADIKVDGRSIKAVAQPAKQGFCFVFDRVTGEPVWPIEERPVAQSTIPGEKTSPTQPFPTKPPPYAGQGSGDDQLIDFTPELRAEAIELLKDFTRGPLFTPPSLSETGGNQGTIQRPSLVGAINWNGGAFDPETGLLYVPSYDGITVTVFYEPKKREVETVRYTHGGLRGRRPEGPQGLPIFKPPYSRMTAINLHLGANEWMKPAGIGSDAIRNHPALAGVDLPALGGERRGGPIVTKTLMICTASPPYGEKGEPEYFLLAYDKATGDIAGKVALPGRPIGTPMTYQLGGQQFIALTVSDGVPKLVAYSLPGHSIADLELLER